MSLTIREAFLAPTDGDDWLRTIVIGGVLLFGSVLVIPIVMVYGYLVRVASRAARDETDLPSFGDWGRLFIDGTKVLVVWGAYVGIPTVIYLVGIGLLADGSSAAGDSNTNATLGVFALVMGVVLLGAFYLVPAALTNFVHHDELRAAFQVGPVVSGAFSGPYVRASVVAMGVYLVFGTVAWLLLPVLVGLFVAFWMLVVITYMMASAFGASIDAQTRETNTELTEKDEGRDEETTDRSSAVQEVDESTDMDKVPDRAVDLRDGVREELHANALGTANQSLAEFEAVLEEERDLEPDVVEELQADVSGYRRRLERQASGQVDDHLDAAESARRDGETHLEDGEYDRARDEVEDGLEACERAAGLDRTHDLGRTDDVGDARDALEALADRVETLEALVDDAADERDRGRRALQTTDHDTVGAALDELEATLDELEAYEEAERVVADYRADLEDMREDLATERAESRVNNILTLAESTQSRAEGFVEEGDYDRAVTRLESALDSLAEAEELVERYGLGRTNVIEEKRRAVESLLDDVESRPDEDLEERLAGAEAAVARGIERRDADDPESAVEAFEDAHGEYEAALELASNLGLPEQWEVEQRHSMVEEYLDVARDELDERRQSVRTDLARTLEAAESTLTHAEQHEEVDDTVSARESLTDAVARLDEATQLVEPGAVSDALRGRYEEAVDRADALDERLPEGDESREYRTRDLVESIQVLATKLDESPRPAFVNAYGEYPADAYLDAFGSWPEALAAANLDPIDEAARERRTYSRVDVLDALVELTEELGRPPSKTEMNRKGAVSSTTVENRFADWETALELASVTEECDERDEGRQADTATEDGATSDVIPEPNELAELYEAFGSLGSVLDALLTADDSVEHGDGSPLAEWYDTVSDRWSGDGPGDAPNYGEQQYRRNDFSMADYREAHGDGDQVTEFGVIETRPLRESHREVLEDHGVLDPEETFSLPVTPKSEAIPPVAVQSGEELSRARDLLAEFPDRPDAELPPGESLHEDAGVEDDPDDIVDRLLDDMGMESSAGAAGE